MFCWLRVAKVMLWFCPVDGLLSLLCPSVEDRLT